MSAFKVTPESTAHAFVMLGTVGMAAEQLRAALAHADARIAELEQQAKDWEGAAQAGIEVIRDIGGILGASLPDELVTEVAIRRMARIAELEAMLVAGSAT